MQELDDYNPRICVKCKYYGQEYDASHVCTKTATKRLDLVTGEIVTDWTQATDCYKMRSDTGFCRPQGLMFEAIV